MKDNTTKLLGLEDVIVKNVEENGGELHIELELPRKPHRCPQRGELTDRIHDYRMQRVRDCPAFSKNTYLHLRERRYACPNCGKRSYEGNDFLPKYHQVTRRLVASVIDSFRETVSATHIAKEHNILVSTALRYFDLVSYGVRKLPAVLSIDEFRLPLHERLYRGLQQ